MRRRDLLKSAMAFLFPAQQTPLPPQVNAVTTCPSDTTELCPLGHCQYPIILTFGNIFGYVVNPVAGYEGFVSYPANSYRGFSNRIDIPAKACSVCGMFYTTADVNQLWGGDDIPA